MRLSPKFTARVASSIALPVVAAALVFLAVGYSVGTKIKRSGDPAALIVPGDAFVAPHLLPPDTYVYPSGTGYDGQFFFYFAQDPLLTGKVADRDDERSPYIDHIAYRYQRILLPALGWLTSWGHPRVLEWTLPLVNALAVLGAGFLMARFLAARGRSPWLSLVFMASIGVLAGFANDLSDPLAVSLFVAGVIWWVEGRTALAVAALTGCLLARELYVLPVAVIVLLELVRRPREAIPWLVPLLVWGGWQIYLRVALATPVTPEEAARPSIVPILGALRKAREVLRWNWQENAHWELLMVALLLLFPLFFAVKSLGALDHLRRARELPSREQLLPVVGLASVAVIPFLTVSLWNYIPSYVRYGAPAAGLLVLVYAVSRDRAAQFLMIGLVALTLTNPMVALLPVQHPTVPKDRPA